MTFQGLQVKTKSPCQKTDRAKWNVLIGFYATAGLNLYPYARFMPHWHYTGSSSQIRMQAPGEARFEFSSRAAPGRFAGIDLAILTMN